MADDRLLTSEETADYLSVSTRLLNDWRYRGDGPPYTKLGRRTIRYRLADLDAWIERNRVTAEAR